MARPGCGNRDGRLLSLLYAHGSDKEDASHPEELFGKLRCRRDAGFPDTVKIAIDAGMDGGKRERQRCNTQKRRASGFKQQIRSNKIRKIINANEAAGG